MAANTRSSGRLTVSREAILGRPPLTVWKLIGEYDLLDVWLPPVHASRTAGNPQQPGAVRTLDLANGGRVTERLLAFSHSKRSYSYAFIESPLPVTNYIATLELADAPLERTLLRWHSRFDPAGVSDLAAQEEIAAIYEAGLGKLSGLLGT